jgi:hypothetical protein
MSFYLQFGQIENRGVFTNVAIYYNTKWMTIKNMKL